MSDTFLQNCKKIGIMGGTFNPIHMGHLLMAQWAKDFANLDAVLFIPAGNPYMKAGTEILNGDMRLQMVNLSIDEKDGFFASDIEIRRSGNTYTYETLQELSKVYPHAEFFFILGADSLFNFERWVHPELILEKCTLIAVARDGAKIDELEKKLQELIKRFGGDIRLMEFPVIDISSTMIRNRIKEGKSIRYLTVEQVCEFIEFNHLYL